MNKNIDSSFHVLFCESIREEKDGKHSYIGVYPDQITVSAFPHTLPLFSVVGTFVTQRSQIADKNLEIIILAGEKEVGQVEIKSEEHQDQDVDENTVSLNFHIQGGALTVDSPCVIRAVIKVVDEIFLSPAALNITQANDLEAS